MCGGVDGNGMGMSSLVCADHRELPVLLIEHGYRSRLACYVEPLPAGIEGEHIWLVADRKNGQGRHRGEINIEQGRIVLAADKRSPIRRIQRESVRTLARLIKIERSCNLVAGWIDRDQLVLRLHGDEDTAGIRVKTRVSRLSANIDGVDDAIRRRIDHHLATACFVGNKESFRLRRVVDAVRESDIAEAREDRIGPG